MQPPPGSVPHPIGQGLAVAVRARRGALALVRMSAVVLTLCFLVVLATVVWLGSVADGPAVLMLLPVLVLLPLVLLLVWGQALVMSGPVLVVDDAGLRLRDLVGWVQVPWRTLQQVSTSRNGAVLELQAPGGIYLNEKPLRRRHHRVPLRNLEVDPAHLLTYLEHRRALAASRPR
ncbi:hypothetical protein GC722_05790 [Auraticoccus sp. F435]|uniref:Low molecular weight protein antigen 6 PH domain-containing protein n=1 Tax=Auraticoccus cholistanensis TaxID=2656650 RepID=A0A6A9V0K0_9ACTN|nr:PH domain-containing protein [Auraticoccus cholistanensis]MVA75540.1 hypothetical protein [Auraticoccus cholistanensis]